MPIDPVVTQTCPDRPELKYRWIVTVDTGPGRVPWIREVNSATLSKSAIAQCALSAIEANANCDLWRMDTLSVEIKRVR